MSCSICGGAEPKRETRDIEYEYKGHKTILKGITGEFCDDCGEIIFDAVEGDKYARAVAEFRRKVNAPDIEPLFIATVRKRLGLDQKQAGEIFGGGVNAFSRYETGKTTPPVSVVKLLKLFDKRPDLFDEYKSA